MLHAPHVGLRADADADESKRDNVLRIQVMTSYPKDGVLGDVLIPSLSPFISARTPVLKTYNIWGKAGREGAGSAGGAATNAMNNGVVGAEEKRVCLGCGSTEEDTSSATTVTATTTAGDTVTATMTTTMTMTMTSTSTVTTVA
eukprot:s1422_g1.t1